MLKKLLPVKFILNSYRISPSGGGRGRNLIIAIVVFMFSCNSGQLKENKTTENASAKSAIKAENNQDAAPITTHSPTTKPDEQQPNNQTTQPSTSGGSAGRKKRRNQHDQSNQTRNNPNPDPKIRKTPKQPKENPEKRKTVERGGGVKVN